MNPGHVLAAAAEPPTDTKTKRQQHRLQRAAVRVKDDPGPNEGDMGG